MRTLRTVQVVATTLSQALERVARAGVRYDRGTPATADTIAALVSAVGCRLPVAYVDFLRTYGALRVGRCLVLGLGLDDPTFDAPHAQVADECVLWDRPRVRVAPFLAWRNHFPQECHVFDAEGRVMHFRRGHLEASTSTFEDVVVAAVTSEAERLEQERRATEFRDATMRRLRALVPDHLVMEATPHLVLRRPHDGVAITLRFGDGREYGHRTPGLFVRWSEPTPSSLEAMNVANGHASIVVGAVQTTRNVYRGCVPAEGLDLAGFLAAVAKDAKLPIASPASAPIALAAIEAALPAPPRSPEEQLLDAILGVPSAAVATRREADALVFDARSVVHGDDASYVVRLRPTADGFVRVSSTMPRPETLASANAQNGGALRDDDPNLDLDPVLVVTVAGETATIGFVTTLAGLGNGAYERSLAALLRTLAG